MLKNEEFFWTDSQVVLGYINNEARRFHVFVANRIQRIKNSTIPTQWKYVASEDNPADHASRGLKTKDLIVSNWFSGPCFLWQNELPSGKVKVGELDAEDPEVRNSVVHHSGRSGFSGRAFFEVLELVKISQSYCKAHQICERILRRFKGEPIKP